MRLSNTLRRLLIISPEKSRITSNVNAKINSPICVAEGGNIMGISFSIVCFSMSNRSVSIMEKPD